jgi:tetratricopeptide (TPR) repeat protein
MPPTLGDDFYETDDFRAAFASQHIGRVFKAYRNHPRHRQLSGKALNQHLLGQWLGLTQAQVSKIENGKPEQNLEKLRNYVSILRLPSHLLWFDLPGQTRLNRPNTTNGSLVLASQDREVEQLRGRLQELLTGGDVSGASADDWELIVARYGVATKDRPAMALLGALTADIDELERAMTKCRALSALRRLTRVAANLSGLVCLTLVKLGDRQAFRRWAKTARIAANEADDAVTYSWVLAQEAYGHYYSGDLNEAVSVAQHAQAVVPSTVCVGAVLAAALEARAQAALGRVEETCNALRRTETLLSSLDGATGASSAFGYSEAQLRFHESNALTHLGDTRGAWRAQDRALELVAPADFMDRAFTRLDRAMCLSAEGDAREASSYVCETLLDLSDAERQGIITGRARQIVAAMPTAVQNLPPVRELSDLLMSPSGQEL